VDDNEEVERLRAVRAVARPFAERRGALCALVLCCSGCADIKFLNQNAPQSQVAFADTVAPDIRYRIHCPDVLEVTFIDRPEWDSYAAIDLDGYLTIADSCRPRIEGMTVEEVRSELARIAGLPIESVQVALASPRSGKLFVSGPVRGRMRVVAYQGPEPVIDFLKRIGGLPPGSRLSQVYVVRPRIAAGQPPEVFRVDVQAVMLDNDQATNVPLHASDQVYIGEARSSAFSRNLPHWMGAAYRRLLGLLPDIARPFERTPG